MGWLYLIGILLVIGLVISGCANTSETGLESEDEPDFSLGMEDIEDFNTDGLDDLDLDELDNLL